MKKLSLALLTLVLALALSGCIFKSKKSANDLIINGVPETGVVLDMSGKNNAIATTTPGDVIYIKLTGKPAAGKQWNVVSPVSGDLIMLKEHKLTGLLDETASEFTDEWWLKIEKTGAFAIQFDYGVPGKDHEDRFRIDVVSQ